MQVEDDIEINPKLMKIINETLDLVKKEKRMEFINYIFSSYDQAVRNARDYAEINQVDYKISLKQEIEEQKLALNNFCINGC